MGEEVSPSGRDLLVQGSLPIRRLVYEVEMRAEAILTDPVVVARALLFGPSAVNKVWVDAFRGVLSDWLDEEGNEYIRRILLRPTSEYLAENGKRSFEDIQIEVVVTVPKS